MILTENKKELSIETLINLCYKKEDAEKLVKEYPLSRSNDDTLSKNIVNIFKHLNKFYTNNEIITITKAWPSLFSYSKKYIENKMIFLVQLGYEKKDLIKMFKSFPPLYGLSEENIKEKMLFLESIGYSTEEIIKMTKLFPAFYGTSEKSIISKINFFMTLGYNKKDVLAMTKIFPILYSLSNKNITDKITFLESLDYGKEEVIRMTKDLPTLFGLSEENIKEKIDYLNKIGLGFVATTNTKHLMQSVKLTYARYEFLTKEKGVVISNENYVKLFIDEKRFKNQFKITKEEILGRYDYNLEIKKYESVKK